MLNLLAELTSPEAAERVRAGSILAIPVGSTEQHGPHLPLSTDTDVAVALCRRLAAARNDVVIAPAVPYGSSGEHSAFAGTLSIGQRALELLVVELVRSATEFFAQVLIVSGHGGNNEVLGRAVARLKGESRDVMLFAPHWKGDAHAGREETSLQLAIDAERVRMDRAVVGNIRPLGELLGAMRDGGIAAVSRNGVLGDATTASTAHGLALFDELAGQLAMAVDRWRVPCSA